MSKLIKLLVGVGTNRGNIVYGNIGSRGMMDYAVIGDTVNLGARLCSDSKLGDILVSTGFYELL